MKHLTFWFDVVSPYAYLAFEHLPDALAGLSYEVTYRPVLFAAMLRHWDHKGPAEIGPKRAWTYRHVQWLARRHAIELELPAVHPFNPLALLRLAWACTPDGVTPNRHVCETLLRHVWRGGAVADDPSRLAALEAALAPPRDPRSDTTKDALRAATDDAIGRGVFGVPTIEAEGRLYWGVDALPMLAEALHAGPSLDAATWDAAATHPAFHRKT